MSDSRCDCLVFNWIFPSNPVVHPYINRTHALVEEFETYIVGNLRKGYEYLRIPKQRYIHMPWTLDYASQLKTFFRIKNLISVYRPKLIVILSMVYTPYFRLIGSPFILFWDVHPSQVLQNQSNNPLKRFKNIMSQKLAFDCARRADLLMPIGEALEKDLLDRGYPRNKISLQYPGVSSGFRPDAPSEKVHEPVRLVYTGSINKERGRDEILEAVAKVNMNRMKFHLRIVGADERQLQYCADKTRELGIQDSVDIRGQVLLSEIPAFLRDADAGVSMLADTPYYRVNPPTKLFEYLVAGLPVVANRIQTHTAYLEDWETGVLFDYHADSMADVLNILYEKRTMLPELKKNAFLAGQQYLWKTISPEFLHHVKTVLLGSWNR